MRSRQARHYTTTLAIGLALALSACKKGDDGTSDPTGASNPTTGVNPATPTTTSPSGTAGSGSTESTGTSASGSTDGADAAAHQKMAVAGKVDLGLGLADDTSISSVVAVSADGERVEGSFDGTTGEFSVDLAKDADKNYVITLLDETKTGAAMIVATVTSDNLKTIGVNEAAADDMTLGQLTVTPPATPGTLGTAKVEDESAVTDAIGITAEDAAIFGKYDSAAAKVANLDVDADGKVDAKGDFVLSTTFGFSSEVDPNAAINTLAKYKNTYLADDVAFHKGRFAIFIEAKKSAFTSAPTDAAWTFTDPVGLDDSGTSITVNGVTKSSWKETVAAGATITRAFTNPASAPEGMYQFVLTVSSIPKGKYTLVAGGKTLTFVGVDVQGYNDAPPVVPFIKFNVDADDHITGIDYKWMAHKADGSGWEKATKELVGLFVGKEGGHFSMYVLDGGGNKTDKRLEWKMSPDSLEGSIAFSRADGCVMSTDPNAATPVDGCVPATTQRLFISGFSSFDDAKNVPFATMGWNNFTFVDKLEMMVSVN